MRTTKHSTEPRVLTEAQRQDLLARYFPEEVAYQEAVKDIYDHTRYARIGEVIGPLPPRPGERRVQIFPPSAKYLAQHAPPVVPLGAWEVAPDSSPKPLNPPLHPPPRVPGRRIFTEAQVLEMRALDAKGMKLTDIARHFGFSRGAVAQAVWGVTWGHLPGARPARQTTTVDLLLGQFKLKARWGTRELASALNLNYESTRVRLYQMAKAGLIHKVDVGTYEAKVVP